MTQRRSTKKGFLQASSLLTQRIRAGAESRGFAETRLLTRWEEIAGTEISAIARPVGVSYARGGMGATLTLLTTGAHAPMLEMQKDQLRTRVNAVYGYNAISRVRITQTAPTGFADGQVAFRPKAPAAAKGPGPAASARAAAETRAVQDDGLRRALAQLGANIHARTTPNQET